MHRNRSVDVHQFSMVPRADIPRSAFRIETTHKTTFNSGLLVPIYCEEVLPGDTFNVKATVFARLATPLTPIMDNLYLDTFFFFVPNRLLWDNWQRFCGERSNPNDSIDYLVPQVSVEPEVGDIFDYFGLPTDIGAPVLVNVLPFRAYNLIWNEWFRDQNLQTAAPFATNNGADASSAYTLRRRGKRHDYFTSCLPWVQKGDSVQLPLGVSAPVMTSSSRLVTGAQEGMTVGKSVDGVVVPSSGFGVGATAGQVAYNGNALTGGVGSWYPSNLYADLSQATAATINQIRQAFQIQKLLERDARGGTRYTEVVRSHFGVLSPDARLQRPEYLGGGSTPVQIQSVAQTAPGEVDGTQLAWITGYGSSVSRNGFTQSFTEHGYVIGMMCVRADLTYQQGVRRMWSRQTRYDFYWPVFSHLGEQAVLNREIYAQGTMVDEQVFGYQERWAEYRHYPSMVTGKLRSSFAQSLDIWHLAQDFTALPTLSGAFIEENPPVSRVIATTDQTGDEFIADILFSNRAARPLPMYSVPGLVDHF